MAESRRTLLASQLSCELKSCWRSAEEYSAEGPDTFALLGLFPPEEDALELGAPERFAECFGDCPAGFTATGEGGTARASGKGLCFLRSARPVATSIAAGTGKTFATGFGALAPCADDARAKGGTATCC